MNSERAVSPASVATEGRDLDPTVFREAMSRIATAVHVLTTDGAGGRMGATVSAVCSVTDEPPTVLVCVNRTSRVHAAILENRVFCVNTLDDSHKEISDAFAGRGNMPMDERFAQTMWTPLATGAPALDEARLSIDCEVHTVTDVGTHSIIVGTVADIRMNEPGNSLLYVRRDYQSLGK
ncbi:flavin reductase [Roseibium sp.]|uniref:flavin reductase n=1 Tax=Roseibium sp. TaxID=1936156 RepID=UPI003A9709DB